ncbi:hypothetical protein [Chamaesiphon sp.]|uniref:hypothetical protein n=1 Tax=Chamaesiphon sp. TaxID=2814140 RepID=UPI0035933D79
MVLLQIFSLDRQIQAIECKGSEPFNVKTLHLISEKRLKTLAVIGLLRSSASPTYSSIATMKPYIF